MENNVHSCMKEMTNVKSTSWIPVLSSNLQKEEKILLKKWIEGWGYPPFSKILQFFEMKSNEIQIYKINHIQENITKEIHSFCIFQHVSHIEGTAVSSFINLFWIFDPNLIKDRICLLNDPIFHDFLVSSFDFFIDGHYTSIIHLNFPKYPPLAKYLKKFQRMQKKSPNIISVNNYPMDFLPLPKMIEKYNIKLKQSRFLDIYVIYIKNPNFNPIYPPQDVIDKGVAALKLYQQYQENENPFRIQETDKNLHAASIIFDEIIQLKLGYLSIQPKIEKHMLLFKKQRKDLMKREDLSFMQKMVAISILLKKFGFRIRIWDNDTKVGNDYMYSQQIPLLNNAIESILSQGSYYSRLIDEKGHLTSEISDLSFLHQIVPRFGGVLEYNSDGNWIFAGMVTGRFKKPLDTHSAQIYTTLILPKIFRGYSLAWMLAFVGMIYLPYEFDLFFEDNTVFNDSTHHLSDQLGFKRFGIVPNILYAVNPDLVVKENSPDRKIIQCASLERTYWVRKDYDAIFKELKYDLDEIEICKVIQ